MKIFKKGFTLAELMVCLTVIALIAAMLIPAILPKQPNKNKAMFKKSYQVLETIVYELLNDVDSYEVDDDTRQGFAFFDAAKKIKGTATDDTQTNTGKKLCLLTQRKVNTTGDVKCTASVVAADTTGFMTDAAATKNNLASKVSFKTNDGVDWVFLQNKICDPENEADATAGCTMPAAEPDCSGKKSTDLLPYTCVYLDVNGFPDGDEVNAPNTINKSDKNTDRFVVIIYYDGKMQVHSIGGKSPGVDYLRTKNIF